MNLKYCISSNWESSLGDGLNLIADKKIGDTIYSGATSILGTSNNVYCSGDYIDILNKLIEYEYRNTKLKPVKEEKKEMIKIKNVEVEYEKKAFVDETKRDKNGNYLVTKKEVPVATVVYFENGSTQTAYCDEDDEFNLEVGISICVTRELMKRLYGISGETNVYNKVIRQGMKAYKKRCKSEEAAKKYYAEKEAIEKNKKIKEQKRREKRAAKKKEREIEILAEAIKRANADSK